MDFDSIEEISAALVTFEEELERLILESFGSGVPLEDTWEITTPLPDTPNWRVTIEKLYTDDNTVDHPQDTDE